MSVSEHLTSSLEWWLNKGRQIWTIGVDIDRKQGVLAIVGIRYLGTSRFRKRWVRAAFGVHYEPSQCAEFGVEGIANLASKKLRANYTEYANLPHKNFNFFIKRRRRTRSMAGK